MKKLACFAVIISAFALCSCAIDRLTMDSLANLHKGMTVEEAHAQLKNEKFTPVNVHYNDKDYRVEFHDMVDGSIHTGYLVTSTQYTTLVTPTYTDKLTSYVFVYRKDSTYRLQSWGFTRDILKKEFKDKTLLMVVYRAAQKYTQLEQGTERYLAKKILLRDNRYLSTHTINVRGNTYVVDTYRNTKNRGTYLAIYQDDKIVAWGFPSDLQRSNSTLKNELGRVAMLSAHQA